MITPFNDFYLLVLAVDDDMYKKLKGHLRWPGLKPECSDSESSSATRPASAHQSLRNSAKTIALLSVSDYLQIKLLPFPN